MAPRAPLPLPACTSHSHACPPHPPEKEKDREKDVSRPSPRPGYKEFTEEICILIYAENKRRLHRREGGRRLSGVVVGAGMARPPARLAEC